MRFTEEQKQFLNEYIPGHTCIEVAEEFANVFGFEIEPAKVRYYKGRTKLKSNTGIVWTEDAEKYIEENIVGSRKLLVEAVEEMNKALCTNYTFTQLKYYLKNRRLRTEYDPKFKKGIVPATAFKKGIVPATAFKKGNHYNPETEFKNAPIGTKRKRIGAWYIKVGEGSREWEQLHRFVWEQENGKIPDGYNIVFLDGNKDNVTIDNLRLVDKPTCSSFNGTNHSTDRDIAEVQLNIAKVRMAVRSKNNDRKSRTDTVI